MFVINSLSFLHRLPSIDMGGVCFPPFHSSFFYCTSGTMVVFQLILLMQQKILSPPKSFIYSDFTFRFRKNAIEKSGKTNSSPYSFYDIGGLACVQFFDYFCVLKVGFSGIFFRLFPTEKCDVSHEHCRKRKLKLPNNNLLSKFMTCCCIMFNC